MSGKEFYAGGAERGVARRDGVRIPANESLQGATIGVRLRDKRTLEFSVDGDVVGGITDEALANEELLLTVSCVVGGLTVEVMGPPQ